MPIIKKQFPFTDQEAHTHAEFYGWRDKVVDETLLDENGNVPIVPAVNEDGTPRYEMDVEYDEETMEEISSTERLDADGNPIQATEPLDVYMDNPVTPTQYLSDHFDGFIKDWFLAPAEAEAKRQQKIAEREAAAATKTMVDAIEGGVKAKIVTVIE